MNERVENLGMSHFNAYIKKLLFLHDLMSSGRSECDTADMIRGKLADLYNNLSEEEQDDIGSLTGDLYMLCGESLYIKVSNEDQKLEIRCKIEKAFEEKQWTLLLDLLRYSVGLSEKQIALYRFKAWEYKSREVADRFYAFYLKNGGSDG